MVNENANQLKSQIVEQFQKAGFSRTRFLNYRDSQLENWIEPWLNAGFHADMDWMKNHADIRTNPCKIEPFAKTIISAAYPYYTDAPKHWENKHRISNYAWGKDYHKVLKKKLKNIYGELSNLFPDIHGRALVDTAPVPEKIIGAKCGVGWIGKNSMLINPEFGSWFFLAEMVINYDLPSDGADVPDRCGTCRKCIDACPTGAIKNGRMIDSSRCISWVTIEKKGSLNQKEQEWLDYQLFGCDICQQVCPWNRKVPCATDPSFKLDAKWMDIKPEMILEWTEESFDQLKINSPLKRPGLSGLKRNARAINCPGQFTNR